MHIIYTDTMPQLSIDLGQESVAFLQGVPTFIAEHVGKNMLAMNGFEEWNPGDQVSADRPDVFLVLPAELHFFLASLHIVQKVIQGFPSCNVHVQCKPEFKELLPSGCQYVQARRSGQPYYRDWNITSSAITRLKNQFTVRSAHWSLILETAINFASNPSDYDTLQAVHEAEGQDTVIFTQGVSSAVTAPTELAEALSERLNPDILVDTEFAETPDCIGEAVTALKRSKIAIFCGDSPFVYLAIQLGLEVYALKFSGWLTDNTIQYQPYPNFHLVTAGAATSIDEVVNCFVDAMGWNLVGHKAEPLTFDNIKEGYLVPETIESATATLQAITDEEIDAEFHVDRSDTEVD